MPDRNDGGERLHKVMARCGIASKRKCEELIKQGRITLDGRIVDEMGVKVDLHRQDVRFDGERLRPEPYVYYLAYKPRNTLSTTEDRFGRKTVLDLLRDPKGRRLFLVGRLDQNAEGLVILTNDGGFAQDVTHPRRKLDRTYFLKLRGTVTHESVAKAREGLWLSDGRTAPMEVQLVKSGREISTVKCRVVESQHRHLSRVWAKLAHPVHRMVLVRIGPIGTMALSKGAVRKLTAEEVELLRNGPPAEIRPPAGRRFGRTPEAADETSDWGGAGGLRRRRRRRLGGARGVDEAAAHHGRRSVRSAASGRRAAGAVGRACFAVGRRRGTGRRRGPAGVLRSPGPVRPFRPRRTSFARRGRSARVRRAGARKPAVAVRRRGARRAGSFRRGAASRVEGPVYRRPSRRSRSRSELSFRRATPSASSFSGMR
jgi:23S rRNA pseudouridine2605 synthase